MPRALIPNSTQVPDVILDHWMAELSGAEFKVLLYIARRTYGFGKDRDAISLSQIAGGLKRRDGTVLDRGTGASRSSVARSLKALEEQGLIVRTTNRSEDGREFGENTYQINLDWEPRAGGAGGPGSGRGGPNGDPNDEVEGGRADGKGVVSDSDHPPSKGDRGWSQGETGGGLETTGGWSQNETHKKQIQETAQETASAEAGGGAGAADALLVGELTAHGVGRAVAEELARVKPDVCRRCLGYLPYARVKTTRGAWLANAIRGEYGPPAGYVKARAAGAVVRRPETARHAAVAERARADYVRLAETHPEAISAFTRHLAAVRRRAEQIAARLSPRRRDEYLADFDSRDHRLELFARWLRGDGAVFATRGPGGAARGPGDVAPTG